MQPELLALCFSLPEPIPELTPAQLPEWLELVPAGEFTGAMAGRGLTAIRMRWSPARPTSKFRWTLNTPPKLKGNAVMKPRRMAGWKNCA